jgi:hypothetical protein
VALSEDQKAMLRLLAQREQGYDDLAALMGLSVDEVRDRVKEALQQLEAEGVEAPAVEPPEPVASEPEPAPAPPPEPAATSPSEEAPQEPAKPVAAAPEPAPPTARKTPTAGPPKLKLPEDRGTRAAIAAGLLALLAVVVLLIVGSGSGSSGSGANASGAGGEATTAASTENSELTQAVLSPVGGASGEGRAIFGRVKKNVVVQVEATGLKPTPQGSSYTIWLYKSPKLALRIGAVSAPKGGIAVQLPIPTELLSYVASGAFDQIDVALTEDAAYEAEVAKSKKEKRLPELVGESALRGKIVGPAIKATAKKEG